MSKWKGMCENILKTIKHYPNVKHFYFNFYNFLGRISFLLMDFYAFTDEEAQKHVPVVWPSPTHHTEYWNFADLSQAGCGGMAAVTMCFCAQY